VTSAWVFQCEYHHAILDRSLAPLSESCGPGKCLINAVTGKVLFTWFCRKRQSRTTP
jgi:hypothetical protein